MTPGSELEGLRPLLERIRAELGATGLGADGFRLLRTDSPPVADASTKIVIEGSSGRPEAVLMLSSEVAPGAVARDMDGAREAAERLGPRAGSVVLGPLARGEYEGRSWAVLPWQRTLARTSWRWRVQKYWLAPKLLSWLRDVTQASQREMETAELDARVRGPMQRLAEDTRLPEAMRRDVATALGRVDSGRWKPKLVLAHDDLWKGNILLPLDRKAARSTDYGFFVIDWGGVQRSGFPYSDLVRVTTTPALPLPWVRREVKAHASLLGCDEADALSYVLAGIADLGGRLEEMPVDRWLESSHALHTLVRRCVRFSDD